MTIHDFNGMNNLYDLRVVEITIDSCRRIKYLFFRTETFIMVLMMMVTHIEPLPSVISDLAYGRRGIRACSFAYTKMIFSTGVFTESPHPITTAY